MSTKPTYELITFRQICIMRDGRSVSLCSLIIERGCITVEAILNKWNCHGKWPIEFTKVGWEYEVVSITPCSVSQEQCEAGKVDSETRIVHGICLA